MKISLPAGPKPAENYLDIAPGMDGQNARK